MNYTNFSWSTLPPPPPPPAPFIPCNNPRNVVSPFIAETVDLVVYVGILPALVTWGVITNVINMAVFVRQGLSDRIHLCLFSLAMSDACFLLFLMGGKSYALIDLLDPVAGDFWQQRHQGPVLGNYLGFQCLSNVITAILALERCLCVLWPLKGASLFRTKYMGAGIAAAALCILGVMNAALAIKYQTVRIPTGHNPSVLTTTNNGSDQSAGDFFFVSRLTPLYLRHRTLIDVVYLYILLVTVPFVSLIVVIVCTAAIILRLGASAAWRRESVCRSTMTSSQRHDVTVTRMLVTVCCVYLACMVPNVTKSVVLFLRLPGFLITGHLCNAFKMTLALTHIFEACNASVNFCIYVKQSSRYRHTLRHLVCRRHFLPSPSLTPKK